MKRPKNMTLVGRMKPVQLCLECKAQGKVTIRETVMSMIDHLVEVHENDPADPKA